MNEYELMTIVRTELDEEGVNTLNERIGDLMRGMSDKSEDLLAAILQNRVNDQFRAALKRHLVFLFDLAGNTRRSYSGPALCSAKRDFFARSGPEPVPLHAFIVHRLAQGYRPQGRLLCTISRARNGR